MPVSHTFCEDGSLAIITLAGIVGSECILSDIEEYHIDSRYWPGVPELVLLSELADLDLDFRATRLLHERMQHLYRLRAPRTQLSVFAPHDLAYGMARMFQTIASTGPVLDVAVFRTEGEALAWLGRSEHSLSELSVPLTPKG